MVRSGLACVENHPHQGLISNLGHWCILANAAAQTNMHCLMLEPPWKICTSCGIIISSRKWKIIEIAKQHLWRKSGTIVPKDPWKSLFWYYGRLIHPFLQGQELCATPVCNTSCWVHEATYPTAAPLLAQPFRFHVRLSKTAMFRYRQFLDKPTFRFGGLANTTGKTVAKFWLLPLWGTAIVPGERLEKQLHVVTCTAYAQIDRWLG